MIVALNNKSNLTKEEYKNYIEDLIKIECQSKIILCPTFLNLGSMTVKDIHLGAQNVSSTASGAYTGEVSASQLKSYNAEYCIVGHSERREYQKESNEEISLKINKLFTEGIIPILCVGETKEQRENNQVEAVLKEEILSATKTLSNEEKSKLIIAYEPIWSIGTGIIPTNIEITAVFKYIKEFLPDSKIIYGGSANEKNVDILKEVSLIDGYLLGGLSLKPQDLKIFLNKLEN